MLTWIVAAIAVCLWGIGIGWGAYTLRRDRRIGEEEYALNQAVLAERSEATCLDVMRRFPRASGPAIIYARHADERRDWEEALRRYQLAIERNRRDERGYLGAATALREMRRLDEAEALLRKAKWRFRRSAAVQRDFAWIAHRREDWPEAARRWAAYRASCPADRLGYVQGAEALRRAGRLAEADALAGDAADRFPAPATQAPAGG